MNYTSKVNLLEPNLFRLQPDNTIILLADLALSLNMDVTLILWQIDNISSN